MNTKKEFVAAQSVIITKVQSNVEKIEYKVFQNKEIPSWKEEILLITYKGGAFTARRCSGNSCSAILQEIAQYLDHGYYDECSYYEKIKNDPKWEEVK